MDAGFETRKFNFLLEHNVQICTVNKRKSKPRLSNTIYVITQENRSGTVVCYRKSFITVERGSKHGT